jgi:RNA polymerase sigma factor (sigma-70 family)
VYGHLFPFVHGQVAVHLPGWADVENLTAEICFRALVRFRCRGAGEDVLQDLRWFAGRVTRDAVRDFRRQQVQPDDESLPEAAPEPDPQALALRCVLVQEAVGELSAKLREVVLLHEVEGYSVPEIAARLELPPETVKKRLARGRRKLLSLFCDAGLGAPACAERPAERTGGVAPHYRQHHLQSRSASLPDSAMAHCSGVGG